jgi:hypothetical protein
MAGVGRLMEKADNHSNNSKKKDQLDLIVDQWFIDGGAAPVIDVKVYLA